MNIFLLGATGRVGSIILEKALGADFFVKAVVRNPNNVLIDSPLLSIRKGNVLDEQLLINEMAGADIVISALNTDGTDTLTKSMQSILKGMSQHNIKRIITIGTAGILQARSTPSLYRFQSSESRRKSTTAAEEHLNVYHALRDSNTEWTIVCPTYLPDGERVGIYRVEKDFLPIDGKSISIYDTADFAFGEISSDTYIKSRVGISY